MCSISSTEWAAGGRSTTIHFARSLRRRQRLNSLQALATVVWRFPATHAIERTNQTSGTLTTCTSVRWLRDCLEGVARARVARLLVDGSDSCITRVGKKLYRRTGNSRRLKKRLPVSNVYATEGLLLSCEGDCCRQQRGIPQPSKQIARPTSTWQNKHRPG